MLSSSQLASKTANHIERNPSSYCYTSTRIPRDTGDTGCILGWMAHFASECGCDWSTPESPRE